MSKKISINPEYFKMSVKKGRKKKKKPTFRESQLKPNDVKKKLISRIKEHQRKEKERELLEIENKKRESDNKFKNEFKDTMDYLEELNKKKKGKKRKNKTIKNKHNVNHTTHGEVDIKPMNYNENSEKSSLFSQSPITKPPPYGILKNGNKPTYRQWKKTLKKPNFNPSIQPRSEINETISGKSMFIQNQEYHQKQQNIEYEQPETINKFDFTDRKQKLEYIKNKLRINEPQKRKIKTRRLRRKITLGKHKGRVGILVKNKNTRKIIKNEIHVLKKKPIHEIKEYLRKHNLMKIGSAAPDNICRGTYESAFLSGDVYNKNADILLHNWNENDDNN
jgi:hypothetical protein